jgi:hypothetical protein
MRCSNQQRGRSDLVIQKLAGRYVATLDLLTPGKRLEVEDASPKCSLEEGTEGEKHRHCAGELMNAI